jgi:hypothetical protein
VFILFVISCKKESSFYNFSPFLNRYLVCDSIKITNKDSEKVVILGRGKGYDAKFAEKYTIYSNPLQVFNYADPANIKFSQYKDQQYSKIYFWTGDDFRLGDYLVIESVSAANVILLHRDLHTKEQVRFFYTAE